MRFVKNTVEPHDEHEENCVTLYFEDGATPKIIKETARAVVLSSKVKADVNHPDFHATTTAVDGLSRIQLWPNK